MRADLPELLPLICPSCKKHSQRGLELSSLELLEVFERGGEKRTLAGETGAGAGEPDEIVEGILRCLGCARRYPIVEGIPVLLREPLNAAELFALTSRPLAPELLGALAEHQADSEPLPYSLESLGSYLDASWGDCATPAADGPITSFGFAELLGKLLARMSARVPRALELGCGVGRGLSALSRGAELVVGIDRSPAALRLASRLLRGEEVAFPRRTIGRTYSRATLRAGAHAAPQVQLICADVLEPPLAPAGFERIAALNLLDSVRSPRALLHHLHQLTAFGGELLLSSPYAWRSGVTLDDERMGGADPASAVIGELKQLGWALEDEAARIPWVLRRDSRSASFYEVHWLRARKS